jgi:hypothetical protein
MKSGMHLPAPQKPHAPGDPESRIGRVTTGLPGHCRPEPGANSFRVDPTRMLPVQNDPRRLWPTVPRPKVM